MKRAVVRAIDTNIVVRFLTGDNPAQAEKSRKIISQGDVFLATTVLLESEWVLRSAYGFSIDRIVQAFRALAGIPGVILEAPHTIAQALHWVEAGTDFADALHLSAGHNCSMFLTFDQKLAKAAKSINESRVRVP